MASKYGELSSFDVSNGNWSVYLEQMKFFFLANSVVDEKIKKAIFLSSCGSETYTLLKSVATPSDISSESFTFQMAIDLLSNHFCPPPNQIIQRYQFYRRDQKEGESIPEFLAALRKLSQYCEFKDLDDMLRDRLVCGMRDENLQKRLLSNDKLTLKIAQDEAVASEEAQKNMSALKTPASQREVNRISSNKNVQHQNRKCYRCNGEHRPDQCKFKDVECRYCKNRGHIERACITKLKSGKKTKKKNFKPNNPGVNKIESDVGEEENEYILCVRGKEMLPIKKNMIICGQPLEMEVDSGACFSIIGEEVYKKKFNHLKLEKSEVQLKAWGANKNLKVCGEIVVQVSCGKVKKDLRLLVCGGNGPALIGRNWFQELGIRVTSLVGNIQTKSPVEISEFNSVFDNQLGDYKGEPVKLKMLNNHKPKFYRYRQVPFALKPKIDEALKLMIDEGVLRPVSFSEWATPVVPVKKPDGSIRLCGDYKCTVNQMICPDTYPLPTNTEVFSALANCKWFSRLDLDRAYTQVKVDANSAKILTLNTHRGLFEVTRLPFGISTAPSIFQRIMEGLLGNIDGVVVYLDDILIGGATKDEMWKRTKLTLKRIQEAGLKLKKSKCIFAVNKLTFLGFHIDGNGIRPTNDKIKAIMDAPEPENLQQLQAFLGLITFYDRFLPNKGRILEPLYRLLRKDEKFVWQKEQQASFARAKKMLTSENLLVHYSTKLPLVLCGDASPYGVGAVLAHIMPDGREAPIAFGSRTLQPAEKNYAQLDKEALSIIFGIKKFHQFLSGREFTIFTDHKPLVGLFDPKKPISQHISPRMLRWSLMLGAYQYDIKFREGKNHQNADALSRLPIEKRRKPVPSYVPRNCQTYQKRSSIVSGT